MDYLSYHGTLNIHGIKEFLSTFPSDYLLVNGLNVAKSGRKKFENNFCRGFKHSIRFSEMDEIQPIPNKCTNDHINFITKNS